MQKAAVTTVRSSITVDLPLAMHVFEDGKRARTMCGYLGGRSALSSLVG